MAVQGVRDFLEVLEKNRQLLRIAEEVSLEPDIGAAGRAISQLGETMPALSFEKIKGYENAHIVTNIHGSWTNHALIMGMPKDSDTRAQFFEFVRRYQQYPGKVERVKDAPWMENVIEKDVNLFDIMPLFRLNRGDGGFYIDKSCIVSRDPDDFGGI
jgi:vanillate/4-hydroxybenzoate decarboxylase subunit C